MVWVAYWRAQALWVEKSGQTGLIAATSVKWTLKERELFQVCITLVTTIISELKRIKHFNSTRQIGYNHKNWMNSENNAFWKVNIYYVDLKPMILRSWKQDLFSYSRMTCQWQFQLKKTICQIFGTKWEYTINSKQAFPSVNILLRQ